MRLVLISALCSSFLGGCSLVETVQKFGPYSMNVQQGNALDAESIARLKPGLSRSQVRFLLGTPLLVDPFRTDRWDYVYLFYQAGTLTERKRLALFFTDDTLSRVEGDVPAEVSTAFSAVVPTPAVADIPPAPAAAASQPTEAVASPVPADSAQPVSPVPPPPVADDPLSTQSETWP
jgi:outer membrane protein assembly factor BamE